MVVVWSWLLLCGVGGAVVNVMVVWFFKGLLVFMIDGRVSI